MKRHFSYPCPPSYLLRTSFGGTKVGIYPPKKDTLYPYTLPNIPSLPYMPSRAKHLSLRVPPSFPAYHRAAFLQSRVGKCLLPYQAQRGYLKEGTGGASHGRRHLNALLFYRVPRPFPALAGSAFLQSRVGKCFPPRKQVRVYKRCKNDLLLYMRNIQSKV